MAAKLKAVIELMRLHSLWGAALLILPCWWGLAAADAEPALYGWFALGGMLMRPFGCIINDLWDRRIDKKVARTVSRPLASGALSTEMALAVAFLLLVAAAATLLALPTAVWWWAAAVLPMVAAYPLCKRFFFLPQLILGLVFNWGIWMGWVAAGRPLGVGIFWLYAAAVCWTLFYDGIYSLQDAKSDARLGLHSFALYFSRPKKALARCGALSFGFFALAGAVTDSLTSVFALAAAVYGLLFWYILRGLDEDDPNSAAVGFRRSVWIGVVGVMAWSG